ncbi:MAG: hypothetical protein GF401_20040 [Chitinivibrionales bacterium]|nr:hypothetical protein [Chitinivibrionales bacterium]
MYHPIHRATFDLSPLVGSNYFLRVNNLIFIGFASCGKSATAYEIAKRLGLKFVDLDKEIEVRYYLSHNKELHYRQIILQEGVECFLHLEKTVLDEFLRCRDCVIAPGGGAPMNEENRAVLARLGTIVYLKTEPDVLLERMQSKGLPLFLNGQADINHLQTIWQERHGVYQQLAQCTIENSLLSISETAEAVIAALKHNMLL